MSSKKSSATDRSSRGRPQQPDVSPEPVQPGRNATSGASSRAVGSPSPARLPNEDAQDETVLRVAVRRRPSDAYLHEEHDDDNDSDTDHGAPNSDIAALERNFARQSAAGLFGDGYSGGIGEHFTIYIRNLKVYLQLKGGTTALWLATHARPVEEDTDVTGHRRDTLLPAAAATNGRKKRDYGLPCGPVSPDTLYNALVQTYFFIVQTLHKDVQNQHTLTTAPDDPHALYRSICDAYRIDAKESPMTLKAELFTIRLEADETPLQLWSRIQQVNAKLRAINPIHAANDGTLMYVVAQAMPESYRPHVLKLNMDDENMSSYDLSKSLGLYKASTRAFPGSAKNSVAAVAAGVSTQSQEGRRDPSTLECWNCGNTGHMKRDCRVSHATHATHTSRRTSGESGNRKKDTCAHCGNHGHAVDNCNKLRAKFKAEAHSGPGDSKPSSSDKVMTILTAAVDVRDGEPGVVAAAAISATPVAILDSGATNHIVCDVRLATSAPVTGERVRVITASGATVLSDQYVDTAVYFDGRRVTVRNALLVPSLTLNVMSVKRLTKRGYSVLFEIDGSAVIRDAGDGWTAVIPSGDDLWEISMSPAPLPPVAPVSAARAVRVNAIATNALELTGPDPVAVTAERDDPRVRAYDDRLLVKPSTILGAGNGLFTSCKFRGPKTHRYRTAKSGDKIAPYIGTVMSAALAAGLADTRYLAKINDDTYVDTSDADVSTLARFANRPSGTAKANAVFVTNKKDSLWLAATRTIPAGSEVLVNYHRDRSVDLTATNGVLLHRRLGHPSLSAMEKLFQSGLAAGTAPTLSVADKKAISECDVCARTKMTKQKLGARTDCAKYPLERVHTDVCGPVRLPDGEAFYVISAIDEFTRFAKVQICQKKSEAADFLLNTIDEWEAHFERPNAYKVREVHCDHGREYKSTYLKNEMNKRKIKMTHSVAHCPEQNGIAERFNRTIVTIARALIAQARASALLWQYAIEHATYIRNRLITAGNGGQVTPYQLWYGSAPSLNRLWTFGCNAFVLNEHRSSKFDESAHRGVYVGWSSDIEHGYKIMDPETHDVSIHRRVVLHENSFSCAATISDAAADLPDYSIESDIEHDAESEDDIGDISEIDSQVDDQVPVPELERITLSGVNQDAQRESATSPSIPRVVSSSTQRRHGSAASTGSGGDPRGVGQAETQTSVGRERLRRERRPVLRYGMIDERDVSLYTFQSQDETVERRHATSLVCSIAADGPLDSEPTTYAGALKSKEALEWQAAMNREFEGLLSSGAFELVDLPKGRRAIPNRWVLKRKLNSDGSIERHKARLTAKGYVQKHGVDYNETFAPVVDYVSVRVILALATVNDNELEQLDVEQAFLQADLKEEIYVTQPEGFVDAKNPNKVYRLRKSLYGLKQAPLEWYTTLSAYLTSIGWEPLFTDECVFKKTSRSGKLMTLAVFVDDILASFHATDRAEYDEFKAQFMTRFKSKDLGPVNWLLQQRIVRDRAAGTLKIDQSQYIQKMLKEFALADAKPVDTPMIHKGKLSEDDCPITTEMREYMEKQPYNGIVGSVLYAAITTRPDIAYSVNCLSRFLQNPGEKHYTAAKRVLRYLKGTHEQGLTYSSTGLGGHTKKIEITAFADSDLAANTDTRVSTTGYCIKVAGNTVAWKSKAQHTVTSSTCEAEMCATTACIKDCMWIRTMLIELGYRDPPVTVYNDNTAAIVSVKGPRLKKAMRHIDISEMFQRKKVNDEGIVKLEHIPTTESVTRWISPLYIIYMYLFFVIITFPT